MDWKDNGRVDHLKYRQKASKDIGGIRIGSPMDGGEEILS